MVDFGNCRGVAGLGFVWSILLNTDRASFIPALTVGLVLWQLLSGCVLESTSVFIRHAVVIRNLKTPYLIFPLQLLLRQLINFAHNLIVVLLVFIIFPPEASYIQLLAIPGLLLVIGNLFWLIIVLSVLGIRFRDLEPLIAAFMPILFFLSPVIYRPNQLESSQYIAWLNPFSYLITLVRDPLQGIMPPTFIYAVSVTMLLIGWLFSLWLLGHCYRRIAFWI